MLLRGRRNRKGDQFFKKNRKGVSIMVGYVLLVVFAVILSVITYNWIRTYVPAQSLQCPEGVSILIKSTDYDCDKNNITLITRNNGRFDILGYFIHAANESAQEIATIDLSQYLNESFGGRKFGSSVSFVSLQDNSFRPGNEKLAMFELPAEINQIMSIQIIPTRFQEQDNKKRFISCGDSRIKQNIICGFSGESPEVECTPNTCLSLNYECGVWANGCGTGTIDCNQPGCDSSTQFCDAAGQCISTSCTPAEDPCGARECGSISNNTCGTGSCGICTGTEICDESIGQCESNGICDPGETCADADCEGQRAECVDPGETCQSGSCVFNAEGSFNSCGDYCALFGYALTFACQDNPNKCKPPQGPEGGIYIGDVEGANETYGNSFCSGDPFCCCQP